MNVVFLSLTGERKRGSQGGQRGTETETETEDYGRKKEINSEEND